MKLWICNSHFLHGEGKIVLHSQVLVGNTHNTHWLKINEQFLRALHPKSINCNMYYEKLSQKIIDIKFSVQFNHDDSPWLRGIRLHSSANLHFSDHSLLWSSQSHKAFLYFTDHRKREQTSYSLATVEIEEFLFSHQHWHYLCFSTNNGGRQCAAPVDKVIYASSAYLFSNFWILDLSSFSVISDCDDEISLSDLIHVSE